MAEKKSGRKVKMIARFLEGSKGYFVAAVMSTIVIALCDMVIPQIIRAAIDNAIGGKEAAYPAAVMALVNRVGGFEYLGQHLWIMAAAILAVAAVQAIAQYLFRVEKTKAAETMTKVMRDRLFRHIERLPYSWHMQNKTGDIIQRCTSDIDTTKRFVSEQLTNILRIAALLILAVLFMSGMDPVLTLIALIPVPVIIWYSVHFHHSIFPTFMECDENEGKLSSMAQENLTGVRVVRAFGREKYEDDRFHQQNSLYTKLWVGAGKLLSRFWSVSDFLSGIQVMIVVVFGAVFCVRGRMTSGEYVAFITYNAQLTWPIRMLGRMIAELSKADVSLDRIRYIMEAEEEKDPADAEEPDMRGDIVFDHVSYQYEGAAEVLHDISFTAKSGSTIGILGGTGSGKSTLMYLLDKLYDLPEGMGTISIGGTDIRRIKSEYLRHNIGIVLQEPYLFSRTLGENIGISDETVTLSDIREAARAACLDETVDSFAKGYDTFVGERGVTLSGGQKQRAAIARMLLQKTPVMIFDDSLSAVDTQTDAKIRHELEARFGTATIFLISHRITTLSKADRVIVLDHGRIAEQGTPEELSRSGGLYSKIENIQSMTEEDERNGKD